MNRNEVRIAKIEAAVRKADESGVQGPEIIVIRSVVRREDGELLSRPSHAWFTGFSGDLRAEPDESNEEFSARAEAHMAELKRQRASGNGTEEVRQ